jgi:hypothetical protein
MIVSSSIRNTEMEKTWEKKDFMCVRMCIGGINELLKPEVV